MYFDLRLEKEIRSTKAADAVAEIHGVETFQIFKDAKRHEESITREAWAEADQAKRNYEEMLASTIGPNQPKDARQLTAWIISTTLKGQRL